jgi:hypothetical protein
MRGYRGEEADIETNLTKTIGLETTPMISVRIFGILPVNFEKSHRWPIGKIFVISWQWRVP